MKKLISILLVVVIAVAFGGCSMPKKDEILSKIEGTSTFKEMVVLSSASSLTLDYAEKEYKNKTIKISENEFVGLDGEKIERPVISSTKIDKEKFAELEKIHFLGSTIEGVWGKLDMDKYNDITHISISSKDGKTNYKLYYVDGQLWYSDNLALLLMAK